MRDSREVFVLANFRMSISVVGINREAMGAFDKLIVYILGTMTWGQPAMELTHMGSYGCSSNCLQDWKEVSVNLSGKFMKCGIFLRAGGAVSIVCTRASLRHEHHPHRGIIIDLQHVVFSPRIESINPIHLNLSGFF